MRAAGMQRSRCFLNPLGVSLNLVAALVSGWESPSDASGHEESSVRGRAFSSCTHGNPLCSISTLHSETLLVSVQQRAQSRALYIQHRDSSKTSSCLSCWTELSCHAVSVLQLIQNLLLVHKAAAATILTKTKEAGHVTAVLQSSHLLQVCQGQFYCA